MGSPHRLTVVELSRKYDLEISLVEEAYREQDSLESLSIGFSGKIGAGKDTVAPQTFEALDWDLDRVRYDSFGTNLKLELNGLIRTIRESDGYRNAAEEISRERGVTREEAAQLIELIYHEIEAGTLSNARDRTQGSRAALQYWATEVRRAQDPLYWVKPVIRRAIASAAEGTSTQLTDVRFFTEAWGAMDSGFWTVRLDVSPEEQTRRVLARDGIEVSESTRNHSSETELDSFEHFSLRIDTENHSSARGVALEAAQGISSLGATLF